MPGEMPPGAGRRFGAGSGKAVTSVRPGRGGDPELPGPSRAVMRLKRHSKFPPRLAFSSAMDLAFSPDGLLVATAEARSAARLWKVASCRPVRTLSGHKAAVHGVAFSPDGRLLATAAIDGTARLWEAASGDRVRTLSGHTGWVWAVAFSPDGRLLATAGDDRTVRLWA